MDCYYYVYILTNKKRGVLYIGVTNDLIRRAYEHKTHVVKGFTEKYNLRKLVYYEVHKDIIAAITREKRLKNWRRLWKINLIENSNPSWRDLLGDIV